MEQCRTRHKSNFQIERAKVRFRYFEHVIDGYSRAIETSPIVAKNYDPFAQTHKRHPVISQYICDVELATRKVLKTEHLLKAWQALVEGAQIPAAIQQQLATLCGRVYMVRGLAPYHYFKHVKTRAARGAAVGAAA